MYRDEKNTNAIVQNPLPIHIIDHEPPFLTKILTFSQFWAQNQGPDQSRHAEGGLNMFEYIEICSGMQEILMESIKTVFNTNH